MRQLSLLLLAILAFTAGCNTASGDGQADLQKGRTLYENGNADAAFAAYQKAAREGNPEAMIQMALLYETGEYKTDNPEKEALDLYTQAARLGYAPAQSILGQMYLNGYIVAQDRTEGINWLTKAARSGNPDAQYLLAQAYEYGWGVEASMADANKWYEQAALQGSDMAAFHMAQVSRGDPYASAEWLARAAAYGDQNAYFYIALMYLNGELADNDYVRACAWYKAGGNEYTGQCDQVEPEALAREYMDIQALLNTYQNQI